MTALTTSDEYSPKYIKTGSNAKLSLSQAQKVINYVNRQTIASSPQPGSLSERG